MIAILLLVFLTLAPAVIIPMVQAQEIEPENRTGVTSNYTNQTSGNTPATKR